jgi:hypothetical protein
VPEQLFPKIERAEQQTLEALLIFLAPDDFPIETIPPKLVESNITNLEFDPPIDGIELVFWGNMSQSQTTTQVQKTEGVLFELVLVLDAPMQSRKKKKQ